MQGSASLGVPRELGVGGAVSSAGPRDLRVGGYVFGGSREAQGGGLHLQGVPGSSEQGFVSPKVLSVADLAVQVECKEFTQEAPRKTAVGGKQGREGRTEASQHRCLGLIHVHPEPQNVILVKVRIEQTVTP